MQLKRSARTRQKKKPVSLKFDPDDWQVVLAKAARHTNGNASEWIRYASTMLEPRKEDLVDDQSHKSDLSGSPVSVAAIR
jgi:hypothetical protein